MLKLIAVLTTIVFAVVGESMAAVVLASYGYRWIGLIVVLIVTLTSAITLSETLLEAERRAMK